MSVTLWESVKKTQQNLKFGVLITKKSRKKKNWKIQSWKTWTNNKQLVALIVTGNVIHNWQEASLASFSL